MARELYDLQLKELKNQMLKLGCMIEEVIRNTVDALIKQNSEFAVDITKGDNEIDEQVRNIEAICYKLLLRQQPVASDLRQVTAALKMLTDMERIGDHGVDISELTILMSEKKYPEEISYISEMAKHTVSMTIKAIDAFAEQDKDMAEAVIAMDDEVDELFVNTKHSIAAGIRNSIDYWAEQELDLLMVAKYFERIGDHATNIAEWVIFSVTGELPKD